MMLFKKSMALYFAQMMPFKIAVREQKIKIKTVIQIKATDKKQNKTKIRRNRIIKIRDKKNMQYMKEKREKKTNN